MPHLIQRYRDKGKKSVSSSEKTQANSSSSSSGKDVNAVLPERLLSLAETAHRELNEIQAEQRGPLPSCPGGHGNTIASSSNGNGNPTASRQEIKMVTPDNNSGNKRSAASSSPTQSQPHEKGENQTTIKNPENGETQSPGTQKEASSNAITPVASTTRSSWYDPNDNAGPGSAKSNIMSMGAASPEEANQNNKVSPGPGSGLDPASLSTPVPAGGSQYHYHMMPYPHPHAFPGHMHGHPYPHSPWMPSYYSQSPFYPPMHPTHGRGPPAHQYPQYPPQQSSQAKPQATYNNKSERDEGDGGNEDHQQQHPKRLKTETDHPSNGIKDEDDQSYGTNNDNQATTPTTGSDQSGRQDHSQVEETVSSRTTTNLPSNNSYPNQQPQPQPPHLMTPPFYYHHPPHPHMMTPPPYPYYPPHPHLPQYPGVLAAAHTHPLHSAAHAHVHPQIHPVGQQLPNNHNNNNNTQDRETTPNNSNSAQKDENHHRCERIVALSPNQSKPRKILKFKGTPKGKTKFTFGDGTFTDDDPSNDASATDNGMLDENSQMPNFQHLVNFPNYINYRRNHLLSGTGTGTKGCGLSSKSEIKERHCVMCGKLRALSHPKKGTGGDTNEHDGAAAISLSASNSPSAKDGDNSGISTDSGQRSQHIIPRQNKGLCTACDVAVWVVKENGLEIKWCKGCKNFKPWINFGDKTTATKCAKCREKQREKYAKKIAKQGGTVVSVNVGEKSDPGSGKNDAANARIAKRESDQFGDGGSFGKTSNGHGSNSNHGLSCLIAATNRLTDS